MKGKSISDLQQYWNEFANKYTSMEQHLNSFAFSLANMLKIEQKNAILEVGAGTGFLYDHFLLRKPKNGVYTATDLSEKMLEILCQRMGKQFSPEKPTKVDDLNLIVQQANSESLPFSNESFDCYISNLCLQITTVPENMLSEAFRVLLPGGKAGFSVWGDKERTTFFTLVPSVLQSLGLSAGSESEVQVRSNFHLNDKAKLIYMLEKAGFVNILCWNQFSPFSLSEQDVEDMVLLPAVKDIVDANPDKISDIKNELKKRYQELVVNGKHPFGVDGLLIIGEKPKN